MSVHFTRFISTVFSDQRNAAPMAQRIMMKFTRLVLHPLARIGVTTVVQPRSAKTGCVCKNGSNNISHFSLLEDLKWL